MQFVSRITRDLNIDVPFIIADTVDEYLALLRDMGYNVKDDDGETIGMYFPVDDVICLNGAILQTESDIHYAILHENAHSITIKHLIGERDAIYARLKKEDIEAARNEIFGKEYKDESPKTILEEFVCYLVEKLPNAKIKGIFTGEIPVSDYTRSLKNDIEASNEIVNKEVLIAILPL